MRRFWTLFLLIFACIAVQAQEDKARFIFIGAHPDDCDLKGGGTAILLAKMGHAVKFISVTNGDAGHQSKGGGALAKIRRAEAMEAGKRLGVEYEVLDNHDGELMATLEVRLQLIRKIREWKADVVVSHRTNDYHPDHRYTGVAIQDAAYMVGVPNVASDTPPLRKNPVFLYFQDHFKRPNPFRPDIAIDIGSAFKQKIYAVSAHESQFFEWLPWIGDFQEEIPTDEEGRIQWLTELRTVPIAPNTRESLKKWYGEDKGGKIEYAEAFEVCEYGRQPSDDEIKQLFSMLPN